MIWLMSRFSLLVRTLNLYQPWQHMWIYIRVLEASSSLPSNLNTIKSQHSEKGSCFIACGIRYVFDLALISQYNYSGCVHLIVANQSTHVIYKGCAALCGQGKEYYMSPVISQQSFDSTNLPNLGYTAASIIWK